MRGGIPDLGNGWSGIREGQARNEGGKERREEKEKMEVKERKREKRVTLFRK